jgi:hypothetical protein
MQTTTNATSERQARRMRADLEELADRIARAVPRDGNVEPQPGLHFGRCSRPTERIHSLWHTVFCVIAQGAKEFVLGAERFRYDPAHYMITRLSCRSWSNRGSFAGAAIPSLWMDLTRLSSRRS